MAVPATQWVYLERDPNSVYQQLSVKGRRIKARTLYGRHVSAEDPMSAAQLAAEYDLPVAAVEEAIAYVRSNPPEIEQDLQREQALANALGENDTGYKERGRPKRLSPQERARI